MADPIDINALPNQVLADGGYVFMIHKDGANVSGKLLPSTILMDLQDKAETALRPEDVGEAAYLNVEDLPSGVGGGGSDLEVEVNAQAIRIASLEEQVALLLNLISASEIPVYELDIYDDVYVGDE